MIAQAVFVIFQCKMISEKCFPYFLVFDGMENNSQTENIAFSLTKKDSLIFVKWFLFYKIINYFPNLSFSLSNWQSSLDHHQRLLEFLCRSFSIRAEHQKIFSIETNKALVDVYGFN